MEQVCHTVQNVPRATKRKARDNPINREEKTRRKKIIRELRITCIIFTTRSDQKPLNFLCQLDFLIKTKSIQKFITI